MEFQKGQRDKLSKYLNTSEDVEIEMTVLGSSKYECSCFGLLETDSSAKSIADIQSIKSGKKFILNLNSLGSIQKIIFCVEIQDTGTMQEIKSHSVKISQHGKNAIIMNLTGENFSDEKAITSIEIYRKNITDDWRIACVASGFNNGMKELLNSYGLKELPIRNPQSDIELIKGKKLNISFNPKITQEILINLTWTRGKKSLFKSAIDLDVGCLYELKTGLRGCIQALGRDLGSLDYPPYIALDGDDRTTDTRNTENLRINCLKFSEIKRILIYAFIYEGASNWKEVEALVKLKCKESGDIMIQMSNFDNKKRIFAVGMLENIGNNKFSIENLTEFFNGQEDMDRHYGWGLSWKPGIK